MVLYVSNKSLGYMTLKDKTNEAWSMQRQAGEPPWCSRVFLLDELVHKRAAADH